MFKNEIKEVYMITKTLHRAIDRGHVEHNWLDTYHSFSFAQYFDPKKNNFGALRVINDDVIACGKGFGMHPHQNMEIITIPLSGALAHKDSMGNSSIIRAGEVQVMSAGTGIYHSEYNASQEQAVSLLQIWIFPNKENVEPRYQQLTFDESKLNEFQQVVSPNANDRGAWIHQQAWLSLGKFDQEIEIDHVLHNGTNGLYIFVIDGQVVVDDLVLSSKDALGVENQSTVKMLVQKGARVLLIEVPMHY